MLLRIFLNARSFQISQQVDIINARHLGTTNVYEFASKHN